MLLAALTIAGCGSDQAADDPDLAFSDQTTTSFGTTTTLLIEAKPNVSLNDSDTSFVAFEASWVCELQRRTFPTPDALQQALSDKLEGSGLSRPEYETFRQSVNNNQDLRDSILFAYQETCRP